MARSCCKYFTVSLVPAAALVLAILFGFGIISLPILYSELAQKNEYGMVIDAGSTHSTIYVYKLNVPITGAVEELGHHDGPSLSNLTSPNNHSSPNNLTEVNTIVSGLIAAGSKDLAGHEDLFNTTNVYIGATAGMRLIKRRNASESADILETAGLAIKKSGFKYNPAIIISGVEEAASGWLAANHLMKKKEKLVGSLDMGGASAEIAFSAVPPASSTSPYYVTKKLLMKEEHLYARSYLCYGHSQAKGRFLAHLFSQNGNKTVNVSNPCQLKSTVRNHTISEINTSCVVDSIAEEVFGFRLNLSPELSADTNVSFVGTGNFTQCRAEVSQVFNLSSCLYENCDSVKYEVPPVNGTLVGFSGFAYIASHLNLSSSFSKNGSVGLMEAIQHTFDKDSRANNTDVYFYGVFMAHLIEVGFGMDKNSSQNWTLIFKTQEDNSTFGWALGYFMNKTYKFPLSPYDHSEPFSVVDMVVGMIILSILCAIFVIFFFLTFYACKKALKAHNGYQSIS